MSEEIFLGIFIFLVLAVISGFVWCEWPQKERRRWKRE